MEAAMQDAPPQMPPDQEFRDDMHKRLQVAEEQLERLSLQADRTEAQRREWFRVRDGARAALGAIDMDESVKSPVPDEFLR